MRMSRVVAVLAWAHVLMLPVSAFPVCPMELNRTFCAPEDVAPLHASKVMEEMIYNGGRLDNDANLVAFASYPHSGSSWLRGLLDSLTNLVVVEGAKYTSDRTMRGLMTKTHRSPTYGDRCPIDFDPSRRDALEPQAFAHLVRNPVDVLYSLTEARKDGEDVFDVSTGFAPNRYSLRLILEHMKHWSTVAVESLYQKEVEQWDGRMLAFRVRYEDALKDPVLALKALHTWAWHVRRMSLIACVHSVFLSRRLIGRRSGSTMALTPC
mmetsp:Transcript_6142/g.16002  ORF Transcript_6142/g.16002 Transcript_6142/m.16002 type:complete len:266 (-) Transcript_6142:626-1423(-)